MNSHTYERSTCIVTLAMLPPDAADVVRHPEHYQDRSHLVLDAWREMKERQGAPITLKQMQRMHPDYRRMNNDVLVGLNKARPAITAAVAAAQRLKGGAA